MTLKNVYLRYLLPGYVFAGVTIGGGYATGRELIEFFAPSGPWGGILGMLVAMAVWSAVLAASFELVRLTRSYEYKSFFVVLLGRGWVLFEIAYVLLLIVVLSVLGAAAGQVGYGALGLPPIVGTLALMACIGWLVFQGSAIVEQATAIVTLALYVIYLVFIVWALATFGDNVATSFAAEPVGGGWVLAGMTYAGYNISSAPAVFFCVRHMTRRREAVTAGLLAGPLTMLPGLVFFTAMMGFYPAIADEPVPSTFMLAKLDTPWFALLFQLVMFGTFVNTGAPLLHVINERVARACADRGTVMPRRLRPILSVGVMAISVFAAAAVGLVDLIARGYGVLTWAFIALLVVPVLTVGLWKIRQLGRAQTVSAGPSEAIARTS